MNSKYQHPQFITNLLETIHLIFFYLTNNRMQVVGTTYLIFYIFCFYKTLLSIKNFKYKNMLQINYTYAKTLSNNCIVFNTL
jgi:hypothetical protein